ncbi:glycerophosphodiester phosphodiesterase [Paenibacillus apiarius]|uniref:Glycerophosphodiester phosphodiesterase n=1 Tax=Paenibacillus apiarius TaxID=46240 RepID=A0ABT4DY04_9BACL|nr:glycerophosphodiester phosphodiesterase [Paenibacillus apiarius]MCY9517494.1 glycerophosphodiester phosphodiesterase [Paenibacillus apiarius]MCY9522227.1 glycerophosphodiester phosphodiesterase [Paenibacillus apiarius]MCY9552261.1 glycerophosphodiester phosphodiesterase [Paenibacillus apiarius]MCY9560140.1 glycerophosphodiester phosphodiesterase [Paenibacillus apiarius]MCY9683758.1 glycerophosphodiester phosphodiesterase [Paenibacillus apiarius]
MLSNREERLLVTAHTGCGEAPANTWASFMEVAAMGADVAELDIRITCEEEPVLLHDHSLLLELYDARQLNRMPARARLGPPHREHGLVLLADVVEEAKRRGMKLNLDIKNGESVNPTLRLVKELQAERLVFVTGCTEGIEVDTEGISLLLNAPETADAASDGAFIGRFCERAKQQGYRGINLYYEMCSPAFVKCAHSLDLMVSVYTVDEAVTMRSLMEMGADSITTMMPEQLLRLRRVDERHEA